ncbi:MAG: RelA/SpoT family protein [Spirochaetaceae bacterium]|nr:RelA/SpoT family protein [Spirochaetaceae bacterium]
MDEQLTLFLQKCSSAFGNEGSDLIAVALDWTRKKHGSAVRAEGTPEWEHDFRVAGTLLDMGMDKDSVLAGLVHDATEHDKDAGGKDANKKTVLAAAPDPEIAERFGMDTAQLVAGVSRFSSVRAKNKTIQAAETMRKMLFAMTGDIRVIIVKLADKLDSMRTLKWLPEERQKAIASECLDIYAPLADRLGISWLKDELEDLSLKALNREAYEQIKEIVSVKKGTRERYLDKVSESIRRAAAKEGIHVEISARAKHFYSIYQKMRKKGKSAEELFDLLGLRLICDTENDCYALLGLVHRLWKPIDGRFKDYIAMPKANGYRSLHTTVMCYEGQLLEVQIRTTAMHTVAEFGVASHWLYKRGATAETPKLDELPIVNRLKQWNEFLSEGAEYLDDIKKELLKDSIFVFTPQGDVIELPAGSTAIDFAFAIHSDVGAHCLGAKADGAIIPLDAELKNTQIVEIITSPLAKPNLNWLKLAHTSKARQKIRSLLVQSGQVLAIDKSIVVSKKPEKELPASEEMRGHAEKAPEPMAGEPGRTKIEYRNYRTGQELRSDKAGLSIDGARNMMIRIAGCCRPVTGDPIVGYISRGRGVIIHRADCKSIAAVADFEERKIEVEWEESLQSVARFRVTTKMEPGIFAEIEAAVRKYSGRLREGKLGERGDGTLSGFFTMEADSRDALKRVLKALKALPSILSIEEE